MSWDWVSFLIGVPVGAVLTVAAARLVGRYFINDN